VKKAIQLVMLSKFKVSGGGRETWFYNFMPRLLDIDRNFTLDVLGYQSADSAIEVKTAFSLYKERVNFSFFDLSPGKIPLFFKMWKKVYQNRKNSTSKNYDYVIAMGMFELIMVLTSRYRGAKKIVWLRGIFLHEKAGKYPHFLLPFFKKIEIWLLKKADYVFANGSDIQDFYKDPHLKINVILNGVDLEKWQPKTEALTLIKPIKIAYVGRLNAVKGFFEFLESANQTLARYPDSFEFHIVGDGELKNSVQFAQANPKIKHHGAIDNHLLPALLSEFHVCVALTMADENGGGGGTSNALLEQMALGLIIVAWDNRIFRQVLTAAEAYLVEQKNIAQMVDAYIDILENPQIALQKAENVRKRAGTFAIDAKVSDYNQYFNT
jgi:glycosyltransferase involved in cell wall biosynthesis